jgi:hypothetical protein
MIRNLREYIPKATGNFFIKSLKTNMNFYLLQYISKNPEMCDDLEEDQDVAQKRTYYIEAQKKLKKINKAVGLDEQISKFFKEDNTKIIENILQQQGINAQNAQENKEQEKEKKPQKSGISISDIGVPPKKEKNISQATKKNLFGPGSSKSNNIFGNPLENKPETTTPNQKKTSTNLFGNPLNTNTNANNNTNTNKEKTTTNNIVSKAGNLFGNIGQTLSKGASNLFGTSSNANKNTPKTNQPTQKSTKDINLKVDSKEGSNKGNNKGNVEPKEALNFFNKNKPNNTSGTNPAQKGGNTGGNTSTTGKKANVNALANLFGKK